MRITWLGHACFMVEHEDDRVIIDPFCNVPGFCDVKVDADAVLCSHGHYDHAYTAGVTLREGRKNLFAVETVDTAHDPCGGTLRGRNTVHILRAAGLTVVHLGDLGHTLSDAVAQSLRGCDVLLIPVGGTYTVDAEAAAQIVRDLQPRVVIPMHYRGENFGFDNIDTVDTFLLHFPAEAVRRVEENFLDLTADTPEQVAVLTYRA